MHVLMAITMYYQSISHAYNDNYLYIVFMILNVTGVVTEAVTLQTLAGVCLYLVSKLGGNASPQLSEWETVTVCGIHFLKLCKLWHICADLLHRCRFQFLVIGVFTHGDRVSLILPGGIYKAVCYIRYPP